MELHLTFQSHLKQKNSFEQYTKSERKYFNIHPSNRTRNHCKVVHFRQFRPQTVLYQPFLMNKSLLMHHNYMSG